MRLTESFHVLIEVVAVHQLPSGTEGVDHVGVFLCAEQVESLTRSVGAPLQGSYSGATLVCRQVGGAKRNIGSGDLPGQSLAREFGSWSGLTLTKDESK